ncbi:ENTP8 diphosphohydrolase, partial [Pelecanoides urinatrix]|nr:ENTP8 diphosphohydrolase [Pelecanoides urinatrix]
PCPLCLPQYGLVFDAGSTHTALYIYRWPTDKENGTGIVSQVEACTVSGPGISSYADNPTGAGASLKPCLDEAMKIVPAEQQWDTPTYLGATAGMRLLRYRHGPEPHTSDPFPTAQQRAPRAGREQALPAGAGRHPRGRQSPALAPQPSTAQRCGRQQGRQEPWAVSPASPQIPLGSRSCFLGMAERRTGCGVGSHWHPRPSPANGSRCLQGSPSPQRVSHPCYPRGYQENVTTADLYDSPCVPAPSTPSPAQLFTVTGTGDPTACSTAIQKLFNFTCGANRTCGFNGVYQPPVRGQFFAFSGFYHNLHFLNLTGGQSLSSVNAAIRQFCTCSWEKVQKEFPTMKRTHLRDTCAASSYALTLLLQGYKFNHTTWRNIHFIRQVANVDVGWTLGYMLNLTNMIPSETPQRVIGLQRSNWIAATVLLAIMLILIFCLLTVIGCQKNSGYERL